MESLEDNHFVGTISVQNDNTIQNDEPTDQLVPGQDDPADQLWSEVKTNIAFDAVVDDNGIWCILDSDSTAKAIYMIIESTEWKNMDIKTLHFLLNTETSLLNLHIIRDKYRDYEHLIIHIRGRDICYEVNKNEDKYIVEEKCLDIPVMDIPPDVMCAFF